MPDSGPRRLQREDIERLLSSRLALWVLAGTAVLAALALPRFYREQGSAEWPSTEGVVTESYLRVGYLKHMKGWAPEVRCRYRVGSREFTGHQITFHVSEHLWAQDVAASVIARYPEGKAVTVYYEPADPGFALLEPGIKEEERLLLSMAYGFITLSVVGFLLVVRRRSVVRRPRGT
jgi:hypothetical protein